MIESNGLCSHELANKPGAAIQHASVSAATVTGVVAFPNSLRASPRACPTLHRTVTDQKLSAVATGRHHQPLCRCTIVAACLGMSAFQHRGKRACVAAPSRGGAPRVGTMASALVRLTNPAAPRDGPAARGWAQRRRQNPRARQWLTLDLAAAPFSQHPSSPRPAALLASLRAPHVLTSSARC